MRGLWGILEIGADDSAKGFDLEGLFEFAVAPLPHFLLFPFLFIFFFWAPFYRFGGVGGPRARFEADDLLVNWKIYS